MRLVPFAIDVGVKCLPAAAVLCGLFCTCHRDVGSWMEGEGGAIGHRDHPTVTDTGWREREGLLCREQTVHSPHILVFDPSLRIPLPPHFVAAGLSSFVSGWGRPAQ